MAKNPFTLSAIGVAGSSAFQLDGIESSEFDYGFQEFVAYAAGDHIPEFTAHMFSAPMLSFQCRDLATLLGNFTSITNGFAIPQSTTYTSLVAYFSKMADLGARSGSGAHLSLTLNKALCYITQIRCQQNQAAVADVRVHALYDGSNLPFVVSTTATLPAVTPDEEFTLGPVVRNGSLLEGVTGVTIDTGINVETYPADGEVYATTISITEASPVITIDTIDASHLTGLGLTGTAQSGDTAVHFRKMDSDGSRVSDGTSEHIRITMPSSQGMHQPGTFSSSNNQVGSGQFRFRPVAGASNILTLSNAAAVSTP